MEVWMAKRPLQTVQRLGIHVALDQHRTPGERPIAERPAAERILEVARELFCRDGIHATGIDRILAAAGASKMTLYTRFGSKEALLREVLLHEGAAWRAAFIKAVESKGETPIDRLHQVVPALA